MLEQDNLRSDSELSLKMRTELLEILHMFKISYILNSKPQKPGKRNSYTPITTTTVFLLVLQEFDNNDDYFEYSVLHGLRRHECVRIRFPVSEGHGCFLFYFLDHYFYVAQATPLKTSKNISRYFWSSFQGHV